MTVTFLSYNLGTQSNGELMPESRKLLVFFLVSFETMPFLCNECQNYLLAGRSIINVESKEPLMLKQFKIIVEKHSDGYVAYPLGLKGVVVGEGDSYEDALADVKSAIQFHIETFGKDVLNVDTPVLEAFVAETGIAV